MKITRKRKKAISLIVLVITILVLAILAATVIISLSNTNIISEASNAVNKTEAQQIEEAKTLMYADGMLGNNPVSQTIGDYTLSWDDTSKSVQTKVDTVKIPDGFYYVGGTKDTGLVISDNSADANMGVDYTCVGNQFVWVPVEYTVTGTTDTNGLDTGFTAVFKRGLPEETSSGSGIYKMTGDASSVVRGDDDWTENCEPFENISYEVDDFDDFDMKANYYAMCKSVQKYNGFYIARFEAGDGDVTSARTAETGAHTVVSKKGAYVYNYVSWSGAAGRHGGYIFTSAGALALSQDMYKDSMSVVSTLCYGVQWDVTLNFVSDAEHNIFDSKSWGNYRGSTGAAATNSGVLQTTGKNEAWKAKNIYDLAGNLDEWTMEWTMTMNPTMLAGGYEPVDRNSAIRYWGYGAYRGSEGMRLTGFRVTLYLK